MAGLKSREEVWNGGKRPWETYWQTRFDTQVNWRVMSREIEPNQSLNFEITM